MNGIRILVICLAGTHELGSSLEAVLRPAKNVELLSKHLFDDELDSFNSVRCDLCCRSQPSLVLLCLPPNRIDEAKMVFEKVRKHLGELPIIVVLEAPNPHEISRLISLGATDFSLFPLRLNDLLPRLTRWSFSGSPPVGLPAQLEQSLGLQQFIGTSQVFLEALQKIPKFARCDANVFIAGETGSGKEMCARAIHHLGPRSDHPFVPVNCGAIPSELVENELFGHDVGAFTGASSAARGMVHDAEGGTLFLDEVDSLPLQTQVKFLRFLQDRAYRPLGSRKVCQADVRIIAASNADLEGNIHSGTFRSDLFHRLNVLPLRLPALRERREDIPLLARYFVAKYADEFSVPVKDLSRTAQDKLLDYEWPGNIRELENIIQRALILSEHSIIMGEDICLPGHLGSEEATSFKVLKARAIADFETSYIRRLLTTNEGNISKAARVAKKNRRAFWQLMRKHNIVALATTGFHPA